MNHEYFMRRALEEGRNARKVCGDNPPVGCVLVSEGAVIASGHTNPPGEPHAEAMALNHVTDQENITAYVTLEPCSFHGRTPSCAQALIDKGIRRVVVGMIDPDPRNNGRGIKMLMEAGVDVSVGVLGSEVETDLLPFLNHPNTGQ